MEENPPPDDAINLRDLHVAGRSVTYRGQHAVAWRCDEAGHLVAFAGLGCTGIVLDDRAFRWADRATDIAWHPLRPEHQLPDQQALYRVWCGSPGRVRVPLNLSAGQGLEVWLGAFKPGGATRHREAYGRVGYGERQIPFKLQDGALELKIDVSLCEHWLYIVRQRS